jgi:hypothetical protein
MYARMHFCEWIYIECMVVLFDVCADCLLLHKMHRQTPYTFGIVCVARHNVWGNVLRSFFICRSLVCTFIHVRALEQRQARTLSRPVQLDVKNAKCKRHDTDSTSKPFNFVSSNWKTWNDKHFAR